MSRNTFRSYRLFVFTLFIIFGGAFLAYSQSAKQDKSLDNQRYMRIENNDNSTVNFKSNLKQLDPLINSIALSKSFSSSLFTENKSFVENATHSVACPSVPISFGQAINTASLSTTDCINNSRYFDDYTFTGTAGQSIVIIINSSAFDASVELYDPTGQRLRSNYGFETNPLNSRILLKLPTNGTYTIRATSTSENKTGGYTINFPQAVTVSGTMGGSAPPFDTSTDLRTVVVYFSCNTVYGTINVANSSASNRFAFVVPANIGLCTVSPSGFPNYTWSPAGEQITVGTQDISLYGFALSYTGPYPAFNVAGTINNFANAPGASVSVAFNGNLVSNCDMSGANYTCYGLVYGGSYTVAPSHPTAKFVSTTSNLSYNSYQQIKGPFTNQNFTVITSTPTPTPTPSPVYQLSGVVSYGTTPVGQPMKFVSGVTVSTSVALPSSSVTTSSGAYQLSNLGAGPYMVTVSKVPQAINDNNGISAQDASEVAKIVFGINANPTANQLLAADATGNGTRSLQDASEIAKRAFNNPSNVANIIGQWRFINSPRQYASLTGSLSAEHYEAVLVGDVTGNWTAPFTGTASPKSEESSEEVSKEQNSESFEADQLIQEQSELSSETSQSVTDQDSSLIESSPITNIEPLTGSRTTDIPVSLPSVAANVGETVLIPVLVGDVTGQDITSYEFTVSYDPNILQPASDVFDYTATLTEMAGTYQMIVDPHQPEGKLRIGAFGITPLTGSGTLIYLRFNVVAEAEAVKSALKIKQFIFGETATNVFDSDAGNSDQKKSKRIKNPVQFGSKGDKLIPDGFIR